MCACLQECLGSGDGVEAGRAVLNFSTKQTCVGKEEQEAFLHDMDAVFLQRCRGYHTVRLGRRKLRLPLKVTVKTFALFLLV